MSQRFNPWNEFYRLLVVVLLILVGPGVAAQSDDLLDCCPPGYFASRVNAFFEPGTTRERVDEIAVELGLQVRKFSDITSTPAAGFCAPLGEESAHASSLGVFPEVQNAGRSHIICVSAPRCECCPCGFDCPFVAPCSSECEIDADLDTFADNCDTCTDTDDDGFGDPEFDTSFSTCPIDNCPDVANEGQSDLDGDGLGDECDRGLTICHVPPGNPARALTITIAPPALPAHLTHGDVPGPCASGARRGRAEPLELLEKLAALVPPPRVNLVRYHGVLAPASRHRTWIVPAGESAGAASEPEKSKCSGGCVGGAELPAVPHPRNYSWAELMRRVFEVDVLECPCCHGRMRVLAAIVTPEAIRAILDCVGLPSRAPPAMPAARDEPDALSWKI